MNINGVLFKMMEEVITTVCGLSLEGRSWCKKAKVSNEMRLRRFSHPREDLVHMQDAFSREDLPKPWKIVCYIIMHYITLEDHF